MLPTEGSMEMCDWDKAVIFCAPSPQEFDQYSDTYLTMSPAARASGMHKMTQAGHDAADDVQRLLLLCGIRPIDVAA